MTQIYCILVTRPISIRQRRSAQLIGAVVEAVMGAVSDTKVVTRSEATIIIMVIEVIIEMKFKKGEMLGCAIYIVNSVDAILPKFLDFMLIVSVILAHLPCRMNITIGSCQGILLVLQPSLEPLMELERIF